LAVIVALALCDLRYFPSFLARISIVHSIGSLEVDIKEN